VGDRHPYCLPRNALDSIKVFFSLLIIMEHGLQGLLLKSSIQRLDNAMLGKVAAVPNLDRRVKAILKTSARAHREVTNDQKWVYNPHQLMEISLMTCQPDSHVT
jgi:hypothetical protein